MSKVYHIKIKKQYAALIEDLIKVDAVESIGDESSELSQIHKDALDKELKALAQNADYTIPWDDIKSRFKKSE